MPFLPLVTNVTSIRPWSIAICREEPALVLTCWIDIVAPRWIGDSRLATSFRWANAIGKLRYATDGVTFG